MRLPLALFVATFALLASAQAQAAVHLTTSEGKPLTWPQGKKIVLHVDPAHAPVDSATFVQILNASFAVWANASQSAPSAAAGIDPDPSEETSHRVQVLDEENWPYDDATLAVTTYTYSKKTGELVDADIVVNGAGPCFATGETLPNHCYDLLSVLSHEAGHFLGLDHNPEAEEAVMYPTLSAGDISKRVLSADDIEGIAENYGEAPEAPAGASSAATRKTTASTAANLVPTHPTSCAQSDATSMSLWTLALLAPIGLRRARRLAAAVCVLTCAFSAADASATSRIGTLLKPSDTDALVVGRANKAHSYVDPALGLVVTEYTVETVACLGTQCEPQGRFIMLGGEVNGLVTRVAGETAQENGSTFVFHTGRKGAWRRVAESNLPLDLLYTLEAQGLLARAKRLGR